MLWISIFPAWGAHELLRVCQPHDSNVYLPNPGCSFSGVDSWVYYYTDGYSRGSLAKHKQNG